MPVLRGQRQPRARSEHAVDADGAGEQAGGGALVGRKRHDAYPCLGGASLGRGAGGRTASRRVCRDRAFVERGELGKRGKGVTAVVAGPREGHDRHFGFGHRAKLLGDPRAGVAHELVFTGARDRQGIGGAHRIGRENVDHASRITTAAATLPVWVMVR